MFREAGRRIPRLLAFASRECPEIHGCQPAWGGRVPIAIAFSIPRLWKMPRSSAFSESAEMCCSFEYFFRFFFLLSVATSENSRHYEVQSKHEGLPFFEGVYFIFWRKSYRTLSKLFNASAGRFWQLDSIISGPFRNCLRGKREGKCCLMASKLIKTFWFHLWMAKVNVSRVSGLIIFRMEWEYSEHII